MALPCKIGFIGGGAMAEAIVAGLLHSDTIAADKVYVSDHKEARAEELRTHYAIHAGVGADGFLNEADVLVLAVKPQAAGKAIEEIAGNIEQGTLIISIVAGLTLARLEAAFPQNPVVRVIPNTPLAVGAGISAFSSGTRVRAEHMALVQQIFSAGGRAVAVKETMMDAVTGLSGSGPAFAFLMLDALADGGVAAGLPRQTARLLAAQTLLGAAKMALDTGKHPDVLRDEVTSPAGTTIAGVRVMEQRGVRGALLDAVLAASDRSKELGK